MVVYDLSLVLWKVDIFSLLNVICYIDLVSFSIFSKMDIIKSHGCTERADIFIMLTLHSHV